jgi:hypothetical protein
MKGMHVILMFFLHKKIHKYKSKSLCKHIIK